MSQIDRESINDRAITDETATPDHIEEEVNAIVASESDKNGCENPDSQITTDESVDETVIPPSSPSTKEESVSVSKSESNANPNDSQPATIIPTINSINNSKRGKKRKSPEEVVPPRETPRRAARKVKKYTEDDAFNDIEEMESPDDPDYDLSDSDDDPDFDPSLNKNSSNPPEFEIRRRSRKGSGKRRGQGSLFTFGKTISPAKSNTGEDQFITTENFQQKRRGRPPTYASDTNNEISDSTVSSTDDARSPGKLSSAYNYSASRSRQNQAIRLPEGPNLTEDQLKLIESQFKSGDFVMAKKDADMMENPPIWRIDGKSLLQKFQAFSKDGKWLYRNISTYSGWTAQAKALYLPVNAKFVFQSRYDTVVQLLGFVGDEMSSSSEQQMQIVDKPVWLPKNKDFEKITEEQKVHMPSFEIYLQTLISQALDNNFLQEIYEENDAYFVDRIKAIDDLTEERRNKILQMTKWEEAFQKSLDIWPCVNTMVTKNSEKCQSCGLKDATMLSQFYGQPYDHMTLRSREPSQTDLENKNFETCDRCSTLSQLFNKVTHQKYDYYSQCKSTVTNMRVSQPNKGTTNVLRDLLANDEWITGLFRSMCTTWIKIDNLFDAKSSSSDQDEIIGEDTTSPLVEIPEDKKENVTEETTKLAEVSAS